jgi:membrane associated rhomboid family serine protease
VGLGEVTDKLKTGEEVREAVHPPVGSVVESHNQARCPRCPGQLESVSYEGVDLDICMLCHGLWFDKGELAKFNKFDADFPLAPGKGITKKRSGVRCPRCNVLMKVVQYAPGANFEVDRCGNCGGVWLDRYEIRKIQEILTEERKLWLKIVGRLEEVVLRERELWERYNAELVKREAAATISIAGWLFMFLTRLPREVYNPVHRFPKVTIALILANVLVFLLMSVFLTKQNAPGFFLTYGFVPDQFRQMQHPWTLLTSMFLHGSAFHLLGNLYFLYTFGDNVEDALGHWKFLGFYLLCGLAAILVHFAAHIYSIIPTLGASGAISGILGAYIFLFRWRKIYFLLLFWPIKISAMWYLGFWIVFQILAAFQARPEGIGGVAYLAHAGGFFMGLAFIIRYCAWKKRAVSRSPSARPAVADA